MLPTKNIHCPYCGESIEIVVDDSIEHQQYIEDCSVCCRPINIEIGVDAASVHVRCWAENEI